FNLVFFFQAEDGIRDPLVTGVQTCALPICAANLSSGAMPMRSKTIGCRRSRMQSLDHVYWPFLEARSVGLCREFISHDRLLVARSEERRVGKECRSWLARDHCMKIYEKS